MVFTDKSSCQTFAIGAYIGVEIMVLESASNDPYTNSPAVDEDSDDVLNSRYCTKFVVTDHVCSEHHVTDERESGKTAKYMNWERPAA